MEENSPQSDRLDERVQEACSDVLSDPMRGDVIKLGDLVDRPEIQEVVDITNEGLRSRIGSLLTHADYAEKVGTSKYRIDLDEVE